jgi:hypothetical protein
MSRTRKANLALLALLLGFFAALFWNGFTGAFERDEGEYAYSAWLMAKGLSPYQHSFLQKPPMIIYTYVVAAWLDPSAVWPPRLLAALFLAGTAASLWSTARTLHGSVAAWATLWLLLPMLALPGLLAHAANTERFMIFPMCAAVSVYVRHRKSPKAWPWLLFGALTVVALLYKPIASAVFAFVALAWLVERWLTERRAGPILAATGAAALGASAVAAVALAWFALRGTLGTMWEAAFVYNRLYAQSNGIFTERIVMFAGIFGRAFWPALLPIAWLFVGRPRHWWISACLAAVSYASALPDYGGHYYVMAVPMLALAAGHGLAAFSETIAPRLSRWRALAKGTVRAPDAPSTLGNISAALGAAITAVLSFACAARLMPQMSLSPDELVRQTYGKNPFVESKEVGKRVAALTSPEDRVFIAGSEPQILYYAKRRSPTRFVVMYPAMIPTPVAGDYQREIVDALQQSAPKVIVLSTTSSSWLAEPTSPAILRPYLASLRQSGRYPIVGGYVPAATGGRWIEPIDDDSVRHASLIVFEHREQ